MAQFREYPFANEHYYHIFSRSIAKYSIFNTREDFERFVQLLDLYRFKEFNYKYSVFANLELETQIEIIKQLRSINHSTVSVVAYCIMPTHFHLVLKQNETNGIVNFMSKILNSYARFFNAHHKRTGPLWAGRFKSVLIADDEQLLHLTRYTHLNPTSAGLVEKPEDWEFSSYGEYVDAPNIKNHITETGDLFDLSPQHYKKFVNERKNYQRELSLIKSTLIDDYTG